MNSIKYSYEIRFYVKILFVKMKILWIDTKFQLPKSNRNDVLMKKISIDSIKIHSE